MPPFGHPSLNTARSHSSEQGLDDPGALIVFEACNIIFEPAADMDLHRKYDVAVFGPDDSRRTFPVRGDCKAETLQDRLRDIGDDTALTRDPQRTASNCNL